MPNYIVTLEVRQTRCLTLELIDVNAEDEEGAVAMAKKEYAEGGRSQFLLCNEDVEDEQIIFTTVEGER